MKNLTLRIHDDTTQPPREWVYDNARIHEGPIQISSQMKENGTIEVSSLEVIVLSASFAGANDVFRLPDRYPDANARARERVRYRATIELDGETVFDGTVRKTGVATDASDDSGRREWSVQVEATALSDLMELLKETNIYEYDLLDKYEAEGVSGILTETAWPEHQDSDEASLGSELLLWYSLPGIWRTLIEYLPSVRLPAQDTCTLFPRPGDGVAVEPRVMSLASAYEDSDGNYTFEHTLPIWTGKELLDVVQGITGMRLAASYGPYPSRQVRLSEIEGAWEGLEGTLPDLKERASGEIYDLTTEEPNKPDFALFYEQGGSGPLTYASYNPRDFSEEPPNENVETIPLRVALFEDEAIAPDPSGSGPYDPYTGTPIVGENGAYISAFRLLGTVENPSQAVAYRWQPSEPPVLRNEIGLVEHLHRHVIESACLHQSAGTFDVSDLDLSVGVPEKGYSLEGKPWLLRELRRNREKETAEVEGVRVTRGYDATPPSVSYFGPPVNVSVVVEGEGSEGGSIKMRWAHPRKPQMTPPFYRAEFLDPSGNLLQTERQAYNAITYYRPNFAIYVEVSGSADFSGYVARVRSEYDIGPGYNSPWVSKTL